MDSSLTFFHEFLIWSLVCFGISFSITHSRVFSPLRKLAAKGPNIVEYFVNCPMCMGFWVGLLLGSVWHSATGYIILDGFLGLSVSWIYFCITWRLALHDSSV